MKFVKLTSTRHMQFKTLKIVWCGVFMFALGACQSTSIKDANIGEEKLKLVSTEEFLPLQSYDKEGLLIPYSSQPDPYSTLKGRLKKSDILVFIDAKRAFKNKQYERASSLLSGLIETQPKLSGPWVVLGDISNEEKDLSTAEERYAKAISINPKNINAYLRLGLVQRQQGKYLRAQNTYAQALQQWKDFPEAHLNLGVLYDIYFNHPIRAQRHIEAYQFLTDGDSQETALWLDEIQSRTGLSLKLKVQSDEIAQQ